MVPGRPGSPWPTGSAASLDGLMVAASLVLISWIFVIDPLLDSRQRQRARRLVRRLAYPLGDVVLVTVVLYMLALLRRGGAGLPARSMLVGAGLADVRASPTAAYAYVDAARRATRPAASSTSAGSPASRWCCSRPAAGRRPAAPTRAEESAGDSGQPFGDAGAVRRGARRPGHQRRLVRHDRARRRASSRGPGRR